jgi:hypothetical protein
MDVAESILRKILYSDDPHNWVDLDDDSICLDGRWDLTAVEVEYLANLEDAL